MTDLTLTRPDGTVVRVGDLMETDYLWLVFFRHLV